MIETEKIGQPILYVNDTAAAQLRKGLNKPKIAFLWKGNEQTLYVRVPHGISAEYVQGFRDAMLLHLLLSEQAWFTPRPQQPFALCVIDRADVTAQGRHRVHELRRTSAGRRHDLRLDRRRPSPNPRPGTASRSRHLPAGRRHQVCSAPYRGKTVKRGRSAFR
jgi:hypothetical protein